MRSHPKRRRESVWGQINQYACTRKDAAPSMHAAPRPPHRCTRSTARLVELVLLRSLLQRCEWRLVTPSRFALLRSRDTSIAICSAVEWNRTEPVRRRGGGVEPVHIRAAVRGDRPRRRRRSRTGLKSTCHLPGREASMRWLGGRRTRSPRRTPHPAASSRLRRAHRPPAAAAAEGKGRPLAPAWRNSRSPTEGPEPRAGWVQCLNGEEHSPLAAALSRPPPARC